MRHSGLRQPRSSPRASRSAPFISRSETERSPAFESARHRGRRRRALLPRRLVRGAAQKLS
jgi:hypothetical protein